MVSFQHDVLIRTDWFWIELKILIPASFEHLVDDVIIWDPLTASLSLASDVLTASDILD